MCTQYPTPANRKSAVSINWNRDGWLELFTTGWLELSDLLSLPLCGLLQHCCHYSQFRIQAEKEKQAIEIPWPELCDHHQLTTIWTCISIVSLK